MKNQSKKKIMLEDLAAMVKRGFDETATKKDLERFATKKDLERLATKEELKHLEAKVDRGFSVMATKKDIDTLDKKIEYIKSYTEKTFTKLDKFLLKLEKLEHEQAAMRAQLDRLKNAVEQIAAKVGVAVQL